jgi:3-oxoacyl-[acyl-carrier-protein] synthase-3
VDTSDEWIVQRTGIRQRHIAAKGEFTSDLGTKAALAALANAGVDAQSIDLIILGTSTPDNTFPATAVQIQYNLGINHGVAFDLQAVCSGFVFALATADNFLRSGSHKRALVIGAETFSRILDWTDRGTCVLFGDGAGAVVLVPSTEPGILSAHLHSDGRYKDILCVPGQVNQGAVTGSPFVRMDGHAVFKFAVKVLAEVAHEALTANRKTVADIDWLIPHQANIRIMDATARKLELPLTKVISTVDLHANTSAASIPLALDVAVRDGRIKTGQHLMLVGVGGGFTWGSAFVRW